MDKQEAIERLKQNKAAAEFYAGMVQNTNAIENELKDIEAIDMAIEALLSANVVHGDGRDNMKRYPNCQMRTSLGNCDAIGGFCTSINAPICDAFHKLSEAIQGWIPCNERLPNYREAVLVSTFWGVRMAERDSVKEDGTDDFWYLFLDDATAQPMYVYAWMPLPKPYREDGEEE